MGRGFVIGWTNEREGKELCKKEKKIKGTKLLE
jgi:hypothetical protein